MIVYFGTIIFVSKSIQYQLDNLFYYTKKNHKSHSWSYSCLLYTSWDVLLDNNKNTFLQTSTQPSMRTYEMYMELEERTAISGIKVTQIVIPRNDRSAPYFLPDMMVAQTSLDGVVWEDVTFLPSNDLGCVSGEVTLLKIAEGTREVKHIKITIRDGSDPSGNWSCPVSYTHLDVYKRQIITSITPNPISIT